MKKYSKSKLKLKRGTKILICVLLAIFVIALTYLITVKVKNLIVYEKIDDKAKQISVDTAKNSTPIIVNDVVVGALYDKTFVSVEEYFKNSKNREETEIDMYNSRGKAGTFNIRKITKSSKDTALYISTSNINKFDEYVAVVKSSSNIMPIPAVKVDELESDYGYTKDALGMYRIFNTSVNINAVYEATISANNNIRIICASSKNNGFGVYSAIIFVKDGKAKLVKYSYVNDINNSEKWSTYTFKFMADINMDGTNEMIIQEKNEFETYYTILEYKNNEFVQILSSGMKI